MQALARLFVALSLAVATTLGAQTYRQTAQWDLHATGSFDYLTASSADHRLYVAQGTQVVVVDTLTGAVLGNMTGLKHVHGIVIAPDGKTGYISDGGANRIMIFDVSSLKIVGEIPTGGDNPDSLVLDPASGHLFTFNGKSKEGVAIDLQARKTIASFPVPGKPEFSQADGKGHVFVNVETTGELLRIDSLTAKVEATWKLSGCEGPTGLALDHAHNRLFSVCDGKMAVTDAANGRQVALVSIGDGPDAVWYDARRSLLFASNGDTGTLTVIMQKTADQYGVKQTLKTTKGARTMALDGATGAVYVIFPEGQTGATPLPTTPLKIDVFQPY